MKYELKDYLYTINQSKKNLMDDDGDAVKVIPLYYQQMSIIAS